MPSTPNLAAEHIAPQSDQKETQANDAFDHFDLALTATLALSVADGDAAPTLEEARRAARLAVSGAAAPGRRVLLPAGLCRFFVADLDGGSAHPVAVAAGAVEEELAPGRAVWFYADGAGGLLVVNSGDAGGGDGGGGPSVGDDGGEVVAAAAALVFAGAGVTVAPGAAPGEAVVTVPGAPPLSVPVSGDAPGEAVAAAALAFQGAGVSVADGGNGLAVVTVPGGGGASGPAAVLRTDTNALVSDAPDNAAAGGNARGAGAVDLQTERAAADQVASGGRAAIGGGRANKASGEESTVGGGLANAASGPRATVAGGESNAASGSDAAVGGGSYNTAAGSSAAVGGGGGNAAGATRATVGGGYQNAASNWGATVGGGEGNAAAGLYSFVPGGAYATTRLLTGKGAWASGRFGSTGDAQAGEMVLRRETYDATPAALTADGGAPGVLNQLVLPNGSAVACRVLVVARASDGTVKASWDFHVLVRRDASAGSVLVGSSPSSANPVAPTVNAGTAGLTAQMLADTANGGLSVQVAGLAGKTVRWVARIISAEVVS